MEPIGQEFKAVLSELRPLPPENMTPSTDVEDDGLDGEVFEPKVTTFPACVCLGGRRALQEFTAERFESTEDNKRAFSAAQAFDWRKDNLYLHGPTGSGKSHLAAIAARRRIEEEKRLDVLTKNQMQLSRSLRSCKNAIDEISVLEGYALARVLVLDDLGVGKDTEFSLSVLYEIIQARYMDLRNGLIITSNLGLGEIADKLGDDRISSRLASMCKVFKVAGEDWRLKT